MASRKYRKTYKSGFEPGIGVYKLRVYPHSKKSARRRGASPTKSHRFD